MGRKAIAKPIVPKAKVVTSRKHARKVSILPLSLALVSAYHPPASSGCIIIWKASCVCELPERACVVQITSAYHRATEKLQAASSAEEKTAAESELKAMGGAVAYQQASQLNTSLHSTSRWCVRRMEERGLHTDPLSQKPPMLLEVGAINTQLLDTEGLWVRAVDLHSSHPRIEQQDFLQMAYGGEFDESTGANKLYDVVVNSMVLNCVPNARDRFMMLYAIRQQLRAGGLAFVILPSSCLQHSHFLDLPMFKDCLLSVGLQPTGAPPPKGSTGKLAYFECVAKMPDTEAAERYMIARHQRRKQARLQTQRRKSHGANFDIDVGGVLGFGFHVKRSAIDLLPPSRAKREQQIAREEFLLQMQEEFGEQGAPPPGSTGGDNRYRPDSEPNDEHDENDQYGEAGPEIRHSKEWKAIQAVMDEFVQKQGPEGHRMLEYRNWKWHDGDPETYEGEGWRFNGRRQPKPVRLKGMHSVMGWQPLPRQRGLRSQRHGFSPWWRGPLLPPLYGCWWHACGIE